MPRYTCSNCDKVYSRINYYKNHILTCKTINEIDKEIFCNISNKGNTCNNDLMEVLKYLNNEIITMKKEIVQLKASKTIITVNEETPVIEKEIITPIDWLNKHKEKIDIEDWIENLKIDFNCLTLLDGSTLYEILYKLLEHYKMPLYIIKNNYYVYTNDKWCEILNDRVEMYYQKIISKLWNIFLEWQNENVNKIKIDDYTQKVYHLRLQNICNKSNKQKYLSNIKDKIFERIKI